MPVPDGERLATIEQVLRDLAADLQERRAEETRTRGRLHDLEGLVGLLVEAHKQGRRDEARQYRRLELRMQVLTVAIAVAALLEPILYHYSVGR